MNRILLSLSALLAGAAPAFSAPQSKASGELFTREVDGHLQFAIDIEIDRGFHLYHHELGAPDSVGKPLSVDLGGDGFEFEELVWPEPHRYEQPGIGDGGRDTFILGHSDRLVIYGRAAIEEGVLEDDLVVKLDGLTCEDNGICLPYKETLETSGEGRAKLWASYPAVLAAVDADATTSAEDGDDAWGGATTGFEQEDEEEDDGNRANGTLHARVQGGELEFAIDIAIDENFHLYHKDLGGKNATGLPLTVEPSGEGLTFGELEWPEPHSYEQEDFIDGGMTYILGHEGRLVIFGDAELADGADGADLTVALNGLACEDDGSCFTYEETLSVAGEGDEALWAMRETQAEASQGDGDPAVVRGSSGEEGGGLWALILAAIGGGIFALLMPCTYPMIPITISFFTKQAEARGGNVLPLSLLYGLGIVLIFITIGLVVGPVILVFATHPVTNLVLGAMFVLFAAVLFGAITLNPPQSMMALAGKASMKGGLLGVFLMGMTLVLTSFTCTAPFVGSLLSLAASGGSGIGRIALGMGVFGLTMAVPFMALSLLPGKIQSLPSSGEWMDTLKISLGFIELAAALKFFSNTDLVWNWQFLSRELFLLLWAGISVLAAIYLFGWIKIKGHAANEIGAGRMLGAIAFLLFGAYCWHGYRGHTMDGIMTAIIPPYSSAMAVSAEGGPGGGVPGAGGHEIVLDDFEAAKASASSQNKPVLINFTGYT